MRPESDFAGKFASEKQIEEGDGNCIKERQHEKKGEDSPSPGTSWKKEKSAAMSSALWGGMATRERIGLGKKGLEERKGREASEGK